MARRLSRRRVDNQCDEPIADMATIGKRDGNVGCLPETIEPGEQTEGQSTFPGGEASPTLGKKSAVMVKLEIYDARRPIAALPIG